MGVRDCPHLSAVETDPTRNKFDLVQHPPYRRKEWIGRHSQKSHVLVLSAAVFSIAYQSSLENK